MSLQDVYLQKASELLAPSPQSLLPFVVERGEGSYIYDMQGRRYLDFATGIAINPLGHCHPAVVEAIKSQADQLLSSINILPHKLKIELAEKLETILPGNIDCVYLCNSGAEAVEGALKLACKARPGRGNFLAFHGGFHGRSLGALSVTASKSDYRRDFFSRLVPAYFADYPYEKTLEQIAEQLETLFEHVCPPDSIAAIIVEPILGEGGYVVPPPGFLKFLKGVCARWDILLIADEVQTGFGRTGKWFACEHEGVQPDIITFAKGVASGLPLGGFAARPDLMNKLVPGTHGSTFGGNPLSCAAALATIKTIQSENLLERSSILGKSILERLQQRFGRDLSIRGLGLMIGLEPDKKLDFQVKNIIRRLQDKGLITVSCGRGGNVMRLMPALNVPDALVKEGLDILEQILDYEILVATECERYQKMNN